MSAARTDVAATARRVVGAMAPQPVPPESLGPEDRLREDLGYDSIRLIELTVALEETFGLPPFPAERLAGVLRVGDVVGLVSDATGAP